MRTFKILALTTLSLLVMVALTVSTAAACDGAKSASTKTAGTKAADAEVASVKAAGCAASASTASATGCNKGATASLAGAGCSKSAGVSTASAGCSSKAAAPADLRVETVRMPSGALAVFYSGTTDATIAKLHSQVSNDELGCPMAVSIASNEACSVEIAKTESGIMLLVTSETTEVIDEYEAQYQIAFAQTETEEQGE